MNKSQGTLWRVPEIPPDEEIPSFYGLTQPKSSRVWVAITLPEGFLNGPTNRVQLVHPLDVRVDTQKRKYYITFYRTKVYITHYAHVVRPAHPLEPSTA